MRLASTEVDLVFGIAATLSRRDAPIPPATAEAETAS
jgi:hypothetical protein